MPISEDNSEIPKSSNITFYSFYRSVLLTYINLNTKMRKDSADSFHSL